jgi:hypothetical protein
MIQKGDGMYSERYRSHMRAHYKRSKHRIGAAWLRLYLSPVFERGRCADAPPGVSEVAWKAKWTAPASSAEVREAVRMCKEECPALMECRALITLAGEVPTGVVQAGVAYRLRTGGPRAKKTTQVAVENDVA